MQGIIPLPAKRSNRRLPSVVPFRHKARGGRERLQMLGAPEDCAATRTGKYASNQSEEQRRRCAFIARRRAA